MAKVQEIVDSAAKQLNEWHLPDLPKRSKQYADEHPIYIYNVSHQRWQRDMGSLGAFTIMPCEPGKKHSKPLVIPGTVFEAIPVQMMPKKMEYREIDGMEVAKNILGIAPFQSPKQALSGWGVFISESNPPKHDEIFAAEKALMDTAHTLVAEGDAYYNEGPDSASKNISVNHRWALGHTNQTRAWGQPSLVMMDCPGCGEPIKPNVVRHSCGAVLDPKKALALALITQEQYDTLTKKTA